MSKVLVNVVIEIIKKINDAQKTVHDAMLTIPDEDVQRTLRETYDELGRLVEKVIDVLCARREG